MGMSVTISAAAEADAEGILKLQFLAFQSEAELYADWAIEPLTQTLDSLRGELSSRHVLVARLGDEIVGSVRGWTDAEGVARIGHLCVHPRFQRHGLGTRLVNALEQRLVQESAAVRSFRLATGPRSTGSFRLYTRLGYRPFGEEVSGERTFIALEKSAEPLAASA